MAQKPAEKPPLIRGMLVEVNKKELGKDERITRDLVEGIARDTARLHKHEKENVLALADRSHPDYYFAQSRAAVISGRIGANLRKAMQLRGRGNAAISNMIDHYTAAAAQYERNAKKSKPEGYASIGCQGMAKVVEENRKIFDKKVLRNRMLAGAEDLRYRLPRGKANPSLMAKMHDGIEGRLLNAASYTHYLGDGGTGQVPTPEELMRKAKYHGNKSKAFTKQVLREKQEQKNRAQARRKA